MLSIEITRECPLRCPGCYAYGSNHLGGEVTLRELGDKRGDELVHGVLGLVDRHKPLHVTLVGGEPMVRHRELSRILPELSARGVYSMIVTSGIIPIPIEWMSLPRFTAAVSIDGLPEHHNVRRHPATYERILSNLEGRHVNVHWTITAQMLARPGYLEEYVRFWSGRNEVRNIWVSLYTPQRGEESAERLTAAQRKLVARELPRLSWPCIPGCLRRRAMRRRCSIRQSRRSSAHFRVSPRTTPPICARMLSRASLAATRTAASAAAQPAQRRTG